MNALREDERPTLGLRERKKAKTRASIQEHALRLFAERGYDATTVEQIAEEAEVSPSTFFRYFPTKEDVVMYDVLDPVLVEAIRSQPAELSPIAAIRSAMTSTFARIPPEELERQRRREALMRNVPQLREKLVDDLIGTTENIAQLIGERVRRPADDIAVRSMAGAVMGVAMAAWLMGDDSRGLDYPARFSEALTLLEAGLPI